LSEAFEICRKALKIDVFLMCGPSCLPCGCVFLMCVDVRADSIDVRWVWALFGRAILVNAILLNAILVNAW